MRVFRVSIRRRPSQPNGSPREAADASNSGGAPTALSRRTVIDQRQEWIRRYASCPGYEYGYGGPAKAVKEFLAAQQEFVVDRSREKYLLTFHPSGYLKRVK